MCNLGSSVSLRDNLGVFTLTFLWTLDTANSILPCGLPFLMGHSLLATSHDPLIHLPAMTGYSSLPIHGSLCFLSVCSPPLSRWNSLEHSKTKSKLTLKADSFLGTFRMNYKGLNFTFPWFSPVNPRTLFLPHSLETTHTPFHINVPV